MVKKKYRARFTKQEFSDQKWKLWKKRRGQESGNKTAWTMNSWRLLAMGKFPSRCQQACTNWHTRIHLRILSCNRMREMRREPEVPEEEVSVVECLDGPARITLKELAPIQSVKSSILQNACSTRPRVVADLEKSALMLIARLMNSLAKGLKIMVTKVQYRCWKLHNNWVAYVKIWSRRSLHRFCGRAQTCGNQSDVVNSLKPSYVMLTFETKIHRLEWFAQVILISATPMLQNLRIGLKKRRNNGKSDGPVKQRGGWPKAS